MSAAAGHEHLSPEPKNIADIILDGVESIENRFKAAQLEPDIQLLQQELLSAEDVFENNPGVAYEFNKIHNKEDRRKEVRQRFTDLKAVIAEKLKSFHPDADEDNGQAKEAVYRTEITKLLQQIETQFMVAQLTSNDLPKIWDALLTQHATPFFAKVQQDPDLSIDQQNALSLEMVQALMALRAKLAFDSKTQTPPPNENKNTGPIGEDVESWKLDESRHPKEAKQLADLITEIKALVNSNPNFDPNAVIAPQTVSSYGRFVSQIGLFDRRLLDPQLGIYRNEPHLVEILDFLTEHYLTPAQELKHRLDQQIELLAKKAGDEIIEELRRTSPEVVKIQTELAKGFSNYLDETFASLEILVANQLALREMTKDVVNGNKYAQKFIDELFLEANVRINALQELLYNQMVVELQLVPEFSDLNDLLNSPLNPTADPAAEIVKLREMWEKVRTFDPWAGGQIDGLDFPSAKNVENYAKFLEVTYGVRVEARTKAIESMGFEEIAASLEEYLDFILGIDRITLFDYNSGKTLTKEDVAKIRPELFRLEDEAIKTRMFFGNEPYKVALKEKLENARVRMGDLEEKTQELKPIDQMSFSEITQEILDAGLDPFNWGFWNAVNVDSRFKRLIRAFTTQGLPEKDRQDLDMERIVGLVRVQLRTMDNKNLNEIGKASTTRDNISPELKVRQIDRRQLMIATTLHPIWGKQVQEILKFVVETAARRPEEKEFIYELSYDVLGSERGRAMLGKKLNEIYGEGGKAFHPQAIEFAELLFTSFDLLTIPLRELQKQTKTGVHDQATKADPIIKQDPLSAYIQRAQRYGGNMKDWTGWWTLYLPHLPARKYGTQKEVHGHHHDGGETLNKMRELAIAHQEIFFDTNDFVGKIPLLGFCESLFPDTWDMLTLFEGETMIIPGVDGNRKTMVDSNLNVLFYLEDDKVFNKSNVLVATIRKGEVFSPTGNLLGKIGGKEMTIDGIKTKLVDFITGMDLYWDQAEPAAGELLKSIFESVPKGLTIHDIMQQVEEGSKGGLIAKWLQTAGRAKLVPGFLSKVLEPLLTHFIKRVFDSYVGNTVDVRLQLFHEVIEALEHSMEGGGLNAPELRGPMKRVIENISAKAGDKYGEEMSESLAPRLIKRKRRLALEKYMRMWWRHEYHTEPPEIPSISNLTEYMKNVFPKTSQEREFHEILAGKRAIPLPFNRNGKMIKPHDDHAA